MFFASQRSTRLTFLLLILIHSTAHAFSSRSSGDRLWVSRPDGSLQCDTQSEVLARGRDELVKNGVQIFDAKTWNDGKMRIQICGAPTGNEASFLILRNDVKKAKAVGFEVRP